MTLGRRLLEGGWRTRMGILNLRSATNRSSGQPEIRRLRIAAGASATNLYSNSLLALNTDTGKLSWYSNSPSTTARLGATQVPV